MNLIQRYRVANAEWVKSCEECDYATCTDEEFEAHMALMDKSDAAYFAAMDAHYPGWRKLKWHDRPSIDGKPEPQGLDAFMGEAA